MFTPPNESLRGNAGHSSQPSGGSPRRGAMPTGDRFNVANAEMPQPAAAVSPGKGAIPVEPGQGGGGGNAFDRARSDSVGMLQMPRMRMPRR